MLEYYTTTIHKSTSPVFDNAGNLIKFDTHFEKQEYLEKQFMEWGKLADTK